MLNAEQLLYAKHILKQKASCLPVDLKVIPIRSKKGDRQLLGVSLQLVCPRLNRQVRVHSLEDFLSIMRAWESLARE